MQNSLAPSLRHVMQEVGENNADANLNIKTIYVGYSH